MCLTSNESILYNITIYELKRYILWLKQRRNIPISKITPKEIICFPSNISKEKFIITWCHHVNKQMKFWDLKTRQSKMVTTGGILNWHRRKWVLTVVLPPNILVRVVQLEIPPCQADPPKKKDLFNSQNMYCLPSKML